MPDTPRPAPPTRAAIGDAAYEVGQVANTAMLLSASGMLSRPAQDAFGLLGRRLFALAEQLEAIEEG